MRIFTFLVLLVCGIAHGQDETVSIQVFYESLCPDSIAWMRTQLTPTYERLGRYLRIDFNPFGFAYYDPIPEGGWTFECQHGPDECSGNLWQACLLDKLEDNVVQVGAVTCIMGSEEPPPNLATEMCMQELDIAIPSYESVSQCQGSLEGQTLLYDFGVLTLGHLPPISWMPWVEINGEYVDADFDAAHYDLFNLLCTKYLLGVPECDMDS